MRPLTPQEPQRSTVSVSKTGSSRRPGAEGKPTSLHRPSQDEDDADRQRMYPLPALGLALFAGVLIGLLFAALISSVMGGGSPSSSASGRTTTSPSTSAGGTAVQDQQHSDQIRADAAPETRDIQISNCGVDNTGYASARVLITNSTANRATYFVRVVFKTAGGRTISDDVASAKRLPPGQSAPLQTVNAVSRVQGENVLCELGSVSRF